MQLRYLQTLTEIGAEQNSTIVFPMPIDIIKPFLELIERPARRAAPMATPASQRARSCLPSWRARNGKRPPATVILITNVVPARRTRPYRKSLKELAHANR